MFCHFYSIFDQINAAFMKNKHTNLKLLNVYVMIYE